MANAAQRKDIRAAEKAAKAHETLRTDFLVNALSTKSGRLWFHDFLTFCHMFNDPFTGQALVEAYSKGERNVGLRVYSDIMANCPDLFVTMMQEANEREIINDRSSHRNDPEFDFDGDADASDDELAGSPNGNGGNQAPAVDPIYGARQ